MNTFRHRDLIARWQVNGRKTALNVNRRTAMLTLAGLGAGGLLVSSLFLRRKPKQRESQVERGPLTFTTGMLGGISGDVPLVRIAGIVPPGSEGNGVISTCFDQLSQAVDIQSFARKLLVYDMTELRYEFGDHLGAFLWNLPALLDGVAIMVAATGDTRGNLESLQQFIGSWIPVEFCDSLDTISAHIRDTTEPIRVLSDKREACTQQGQVFKPGDTAVPIVLLGSRQTGQQYRTGQGCRNDSDLDCGVVGGPKELALLTMKMSREPDLIPNVEHPPIKMYSSANEATAQGLLVIMPNRE